MSGNPDGGICFFCGKQISGSGSHPCNAKGGKKISFTEATTPKRERVQCRNPWGDDLLASMHNRLTKQKGVSHQETGELTRKSPVGLLEL